MAGLNEPGASVNLDDEVDRILNESLEVPGEAGPPGGPDKPPQPEGSRETTGEPQPPEEPDKRTKTGAPQELSEAEFTQLPEDVQEHLNGVADRLKAIEDGAEMDWADLEEIGDDQIKQLPQKVQDHLAAAYAQFKAAKAAAGEELQELSEELLKQLPKEVQQYLNKVQDKLKKADGDTKAARDAEAAHRTKLAEKGREMDALNKALADDDKAHDDLLKAEEAAFRTSYGEAQAVIQNSNRQALAWQNKATELEEVGDTAGANKAQQNAKFYQDQALDANLQAQTNLQTFNTWRKSTQLQHYGKREQALLEAMPEFKPLQPKFDSFCRSHGLNALLVRGDMKIMQQVYQTMLDSERGRTENFVRIKKQLETNLLKRAERLVNARQPGGGGSSRIVDGKAKDDGLIPELSGAEDYGGL